MDHLKPQWVLKNVSVAGLRPCSRVLSDSSHLCSHEGQGVHAIRSSQQATDHSQAATGQQQGHQQANHSNVAVHGGGGRERELQKKRKYSMFESVLILSCFLELSRRASIQISTTFTWNCGQSMDFSALSCKNEGWISLIVGETC